MPPTIVDNIKRFWGRTRRNGSCLEVIGWRDKDGYGRFGVRLAKKKRHGKNQRYLTVIAHRWIYSQTIGDPGEHLMHSCDNPPCVALQHLSPGNPRLNYWDAASKGRDSGYGERHPHAKVTWKDVAAIRRSRASNKLLSQRYGLGLDQIRKIRNGKAWRGRGGGRG